MVLDFDNLTVTDAPSVKGSEYQETFPCFSPNGQTIFFCRAKHHPQPDSLKQMKYDIAAVQFNPETGKIGDKVYTVVINDIKTGEYVVHTIHGLGVYKGLSKQDIEDLFGSEDIKEVETNKNIVDFYTALCNFLYRAV